MSCFLLDIIEDLDSNLGSKEVLTNPFDTEETDFSPLEFPPSVPFQVDWRLSENVYQFHMNL